MKKQAQFLLQVVLIGGRFIQDSNFHIPTLGVVAINPWQLVTNKIVQARIEKAFFSDMISIV